MEKNKKVDLCNPQLACDMAKTKTVDCFNRSFSPVADTQKVPVFDIPVVLAEVELQADVEADIRLPTPAKEIKRIRNNVSLTQCKAIPSLQKPGYVKIFVSGVVHKNIEFVEECSGYVMHYSVDTNFSCNQQVHVFNNPIEYLSQKSSVNERRFLDEKGLGADPHIGGSRSFEFFNEPIECKLLFSEVNELDLFKRYNSHGQFKKITEKVEITLFFKLLQTQQVTPKITPYPKQNCSIPWSSAKDVQKTARERFIENIQGMYRIK